MDIRRPTVVLKWGSELLNFVVLRFRGSEVAIQPERTSELRDLRLRRSEVAIQPAWTSELRDLRLRRSEVLRWLSSPNGLLNLRTSEPQNLRTSEPYNLRTL